MNIFLILIGIGLVAGIGFMLYLSLGTYFASPAGKPFDPQNPFGYFWGKFNKDKLFYVPVGGSAADGIEVVGANTTSFEMLDEEYAKDKNRVYYQHTPIKVDLATFHVENKVPKDAQHVYYIDAAGGASVISGADPDSYHEIEHHPQWAKDRAHYFYNGQRVEGIDYEAFVLMSDAWAKDDRHLYQLTAQGVIPVDANVSEITLISPAVVRDEQRVYVSTEMSDADELQMPPFSAFEYQMGSALELLSNLHIRHNGVVYYCGIATDIDAVSFHPFIDHQGRLVIGFSKDKNSVYLFDRALPHIDAASFTYENNDFRDKDNHYDSNGEVITPLNEAVRL